MEDGKCIAADGLGAHCTNIEIHRSCICLSRTVFWSLAHIRCLNSRRKLFNSFLDSKRRLLCTMCRLQSTLVLAIWRLLNASNMHQITPLELIYSTVFGLSLPHYSKAVYISISLPFRLRRSTGSSRISTPGPTRWFRWLGNIY